MFLLNIKSIKISFYIPLIEAFIRLIYFACQLFIWALREKKKQNNH